MAYMIVDNLRGFFVSRPPLVVFMICLASFAIALLTFAYIVKINDMTNPDITEDWNTFLDSLSQKQFCASEQGAGASNATVAFTTAGDRTLNHHIQPLFNGRNTGQGHNPTVSSSTSTVVPPGTDVMNVSVLMEVEVKATSHLKQMAAQYNVTFISATLKHSQLGFKGLHGDLEANVTVMLPAFGNLTSNCKRGGLCYRLQACVSMVALKQFFPRTKRPSMDDMCMKEFDYYGENHFQLEVTSTYCIANKSALSMKHQYDPTLTVMLTMQQDRSIINLHLMHTSYFLFVMIVTLFCYAIIKGRPAKVKVVYTQCPSDKVRASSPSQV